MPTPSAPKKAKKPASAGDKKKKDKKRQTGGTGPLDLIVPLALIGAASAAKAMTSSKKKPSSASAAKKPATSAKKSARRRVAVGGGSSDASEFHMAADPAPLHHGGSSAGVSAYAAPVSASADLQSGGTASQHARIAQEFRHMAEAIGAHLRNQDVMRSGNSRTNSARR